ncbi:hypothetical protein [Arthrobacter sp. D2-10]
MMLEPSPLLLLVYGLVPALISALLLYVVVRFGVKHGMRAYYAEERRSPSN